MLNKLDLQEHKSSDVDLVGGRAGLYDMSSRGMGV
jgi:hypothetical protein